MSFAVSNLSNKEINEHYSYRHDDADGTSAIIPLLKGTILNNDATLTCVNIMLDTGSSTNFITKSLSQNNDIYFFTSPHKQELELTTLNDVSIYDTYQVTFKLITPNKKVININAFQMETITTIPPIDIIIPEKWTSKMNVTYPQPARAVDILLGVRDTMNIISQQVKLHNATYCLLKTPWGFVPAGFQQVQKAYDDFVQFQHKNEAFPAASQTQKLASICERQWQLEEMPFDNVSETLTQDEIFATQKVEQLLSYDPKAQRFTIGLLFRTKPVLLNNYFSAIARLDNMLRKLKQNKTHAQLYNDVVQQYIKDDIVELIQDPVANDKNRTDVYYMPHRAIVKEARETTKVRPVFDASAKTPSGFSLNDHILPGPSLHADLLAIQVKFRSYKLCASSDVKSMFTNISMQETDRDFIRFLWKNPVETKINQPVQIYRFKTVLFGLRDAPYAAMSALQAIAKLHLKNAGNNTLLKQACETILTAMYVDDLIFGANTSFELQQLSQEIIKVLKTASFHLRKWASNDTHFLQTLPKEHRAAAAEISLHAKDEEYNDDPATMSQLGYTWSPAADTLMFKAYTKLHLLNKNTKTCVARLLAMIFDPLGIVSPFILLARKILKQTFVLDLNWKEHLPSDLHKTWQTWVNDTKNLHKIIIPRYVPNNETTTVHVTTDASVDGLGVAIYLRTKIDNKWQSNLLLAKSKVAPKKTLTVPRLELTAAVLAVKMATFVHEQLQISKDKIFIYSDSLVVLYWITKNPNDLIPFVANRIKVIQQHAYQFSYVNTKDNPADHASRGLTVQQLLSSNWFHGPPFLTLSRKEWPDRTIDFTAINKNEGLKKQVILAMPALTIRLKPGKFHSKEAPPPQSLCNLVSYKDSYYALIKQTARIMKIIQVWYDKTKASIATGNKKPREKRDITHFPQPSLYLHQKAKYYWLSEIQKQHFEKDLQALVAKQPIAKHSQLRKLAPSVKDKFGYQIIHLNSRVFTQDQKEGPLQLPVIPSNSAFTALLIQHYHVVNQHAGVDWLHFYLRQQYFIIKSRQVIRQQYKKCVTCQKVNTTQFQQIMAPLPFARINQNPPYTYCGLDHTGYLEIKDSYDENHISKAYIVLFCCMTTRSVTLELVHSCNTDDFLMAVQRLAAERGMPQVFMSDNHQTYKCAETIVAKAIEATITEAGKKQQLPFKWVYSTSMQSSTGGAWEALIKSLKQPLHKILPKALLSYVELQTILKTIQRHLNDRPLMSTAVDTIEALTPSMLTHGHKLTPFPKFLPKTMPTQKIDVQERWRHRISVTQQIWNAWQKLYVLQLQQRGKWFSQRPNIKVNDLVLVETHLIKKHMWPMARVLEVRKGRDGHVRSVSLWYGVDGKTNKAKKQVITRSIRQLCPLESTLQTNPSDRDRI